MATGGLWRVPSPALTLLADESWVLAWQSRTRRSRQRPPSGPFRCLKPEAAGLPSVAVPHLIVGQPPSRMHTYRVRPGYGSSELLIEFGSTLADREFAQDLKTIFVQHGFRLRKRGHYVLGLVYEYSSPVGRFEVTDDGWAVFVTADKNQAAIQCLDGLLEASGWFTKQDVDFAEYALLVMGKIDASGCH